MSVTAKHCVFLIIDNEPEDARKCVAILKPYLAEQGILVSVEHVETSVAKGCDVLSLERGCDVVLLDIKNVDDDRTGILRLRAVNPYVPIVMLSNQFGPDDVLDYQALGARTFIPKDRLRPGGNEKNSPHEARRKDGERRESQLKTVANRLKRIVEEYRPVKDLMNRPIEGGGVVTKREANNSETEDRVAYLELLHGSRCGAVFPSVTRKLVQGNAFVYQIPYFDLKTMRSLVLDALQKEPCEQMVREGVKKVIEFMTTEMYLGFRTNDYDRGKTGGIVTGRILERLQSAQQMALQELNSADNSGEASSQFQWNFLKTLLEEKELSDGLHRSFKHPFSVIRELMGDPGFVERMTPPFLTRTHGDLHFGNIMVDDRLARTMRFRLIDPKPFVLWGALGFNDPAYDFGKMFQSTSGHYDLIQSRYLKPDFTYYGIRPLIPEEWVEAELPGGYSGASVTSRIQLYRDWTKKVFEETATFIEQTVTQARYFSEDTDWLVRARFYEAAHMLSATPVQPDPTRAAAVFIRGVELLNAFFERYSAGNFPKPSGQVKIEVRN